MEDGLAMARQAVEQGISTIVATPHYNRIYENTRESILVSVVELNRSLQQTGIPLQVIAGQECRIYGELIEGLQSGELLTINDGGKYMLVEFSHSSVPIIVHPERNQRLISEPDMISEYVEKGMLMQATAASIVGAFGKKVQRFYMQMLEANLVYFIASDAHNVTTRDSKMKEAYELIEKKFGAQYVSYLQKNARIVDGAYIVNRMSQPMKCKRFLGLF